MRTATVPTPSTNGSVQKIHKDQTVYSVLVTTDYDKFKFMSDNRTLNLLHLRRLVESFKEHFLVCPIIVNGKLEVIDGQHRLRAAIETKKPVYYIKIDGYGIKEVQVLNQHQKNWQKMDFLHMYVAERSKPYLAFKQFMDDFPDFQFQACERILTEKARGTTQTVGGNGNGKMRLGIQDFQQGKLQIPDLARAYTNARKILEFKPYFDLFASRDFVAAVMPLLTSKKYSHKEMIAKLQVCPIKLEKGADVMAYRLQIEDIYNYKRQKENRVSFKYIE